jgi:hypothetical protein
VRLYQYWKSQAHFFFFVKEFAVVVQIVTINFTIQIVIVVFNVKIKQSRYRPGVAQRIPGS